eukprot:CAMPEP_0168857200 /NCGR_PEP_ID=MMETSP0727-20121128/15605_1 /TAXON_ID=265536 /ORGANISM="Amphiprora sp., Strain CCMP467" /LENGTH=1184 /DNA_ID=CAMNT_0008911817 /DNA_START=100 /DNA_END=3654 /DNA_ORIENTATION=-
MDSQASTSVSETIRTVSAASHAKATSQSAFERLLEPTPESWTLVAALQLLQPQEIGDTVYFALQLLQPQEIGDTVYLLPTGYLQNWLYWAYNQASASPAEQSRAREALKHVALYMGLVPPTEESSFSDPGPMDAAGTLAVQGHPMVLKPTVRLHRGLRAFDASDPSANNSSSTSPRSHISPKSSLGHQRQTTSSHIKLPPKPASTKNMVARAKMNGHTHFDHHDTMSSSLNKASAALNGGDSNNSDQHDCVAVPEAFYNSLRNVHGVICQDGFSVSFQPARAQSEGIILQHESHGNQEDRNMIHRRMNEPKSPIHSMSALVGDNLGNGKEAVPVEYRRKVIAGEMAVGADSKVEAQMERLSLMDKLMFEEEKRRRPTMPVPEIHPIKFLYRLNNNESNQSTSNGSFDATTAPWQSDGFILVSQASSAVDALTALIRVAAPKAANQTVRIWSRRQYPYEGTTRSSPVASVTQAKSTLELVAFGQMKEENRKSKRPLTVGEWVKRHSVSGSERQVECLLELRQSSSAGWPRESLELMRRVQVGDFVDAQDVAGKWYEARVCNVTETSVKVHYIGWSSKWDTELKRWPDSHVSGLANKLFPPASLWSRTPRWRERLTVGDIVEVRDTSSLLQRPKWYKGEIKRIGKPSDPMRPLDGGADLEVYQLDAESEEKEALLLLDRGQQILVEVAQERSEKAGSAFGSSPVHREIQPADLDINASASLVAEPPFLRWVNLYGEEVCELGTHLKSYDDVKTPATLKYDVETGRKPVEIMRTPSGGAGFMRESLRGAPPAPGSVGLHNLGNSCFLNSTVQCLNHMEPITQYFLRDTYTGELNRQNPLGSGGNVAMAYASLIKQMWSGDYSVLAPRSLKQTVAAFAPQFDNSYQHDSQEFCQFLMDGLHEDLNRVKTKPYVEELEGFGMEDQRAAIESWRKHLLRHDSIFVDHCQGMHRSHLTCPQCGRESIKFDVYSSISLPLATKKHHASIQLEDCIEMFMEGEQLDERNAWYCPSCRRHVCALKMIALWSVPDVLILHLKRFQFDTCMSSGGMLRSKIDDTVTFPIEGLDLTKFILGPIDPDAPPVYKLFGVSEHTGYTANSGHYTATVRNSIDGQWYRCNDSHVGRTSGEAAITGGAYLLFYQRSKGSSKWAGMADVMKARGVDPYGGLNVDQDGFKQVKTKSGKKKKRSKH